MFAAPDNCLLASNSAVLASESFLAPMKLRSEARSTQAAFDGLQRAFEEVKGHIPKLAETAAGVSLVPFDAAVSPRVSRVEVSRRSKEYRFDLTFALQCPIPKQHGFWERVRFVAAVYERLFQVAATFENRKGIYLDLEEARLDQQKDDPEQLPMRGK